MTQLRGLMAITNFYDFSDKTKKTNNNTFDNVV